MIFDTINKMKQKFFCSKKINIVGICLFFLIYFLIGLCIFKDYGISTDEPFERSTMYINMNYIMTQLGRGSTDVPALETYEDKYYGMALQMPTAIFELGDRGFPFIYTCRHLYTFIICFIGYLSFFWLCKKIFSSNMMGLLGVTMIALYPRFFAEQFYNIKDLVFVSVFMIAMWATERLITNKFSWKWVILFTVISAFATNVRIFGMIIMAFAIGYLWIACILERVYQTKVYDLTWKRALLISAAMLVLYMALWIILLPGAWENPIHSMMEMFTDFSDYDWQGKIVFMGKVIEDNQLPWYYIPVWLLVSLPIWYIICFLATGGIVACNAVSLIKKKKNLLLNVFFENKFLTWCAALFLIPWVGIVAINATMYNAWRHCYFLLPPIVMFILYGVDFVRKRGKKGYQIAFAFLIIIGIASQVKWICVNHPYEMVYFNEIGRKHAADFDRDYWHLAELQAYQYIAENDSGEKITLNSSGAQRFLDMLDEEERTRIEVTDNPTYYIETYRGIVGNECEKEGYEEIYSIEVDHFKVASVLRKLSTD